MDFYNGKILIVDMSDKSVQESELSETRVSELKGGVGISSWLINEYGDDVIVIGTGILTCSFFPASCVGFVSWKGDSGIKHLPLNWFYAPEFKLTGFDFLVIKGASDTPSHLWIRDEICDVLNGEALEGLDVWGIVDKLKDEHGDENIHILVAGGNALSQDYWGGFDSNGCNDVFVKKNLKAIAVRGMGGLFFEEEKFEKFVEIVRRAKKEIEVPLWEETLSQKKGISELLHRAVSCFNCGLRCNPFIMHRETPKKMEESEIDEPGFLVLNPDYIQEGTEEAEDNLKKGNIPVKDNDSIPTTYVSFLKLHKVDISEDKLLKYLNVGVCPIFMERIFKGEMSFFKDILGELAQEL